ncbi:hypothetical protein TRFO_19726 [Tritrichomonas foetus]|uniref:Uncharacterized protein n=1 Tax=Tritrichomonas foetus TaxID=1144522 RepID=A0A1J4KIT0_9EUKA|nr:hypothetical protein TRFO_19726 [Tritrichomonas foetus]|eukprot:OHT10840.1 hypothetical protein TRFO_19726 [Tritrichomonas foetus]
MSLRALLALVPPNSYDLANEFLDDMESVRFDAITRHRTLTVLPIAMLSESKYPSRFLPQQKAFIQHVLSRPVLTSREATPTFIQFASLLVNFVYKNIQLFAKAVSVRMAKGDSHFLIYSSVPSFFGFFTSHDHSIAAAEFYTCVMKTVPPEYSAEVIQPFLNSALTHRFIESAIYPLALRFSLYFQGNYTSKPKSGRDSKTNQTITSLARSLRSLILAAAPLLPDVIRIIFSETIILHWTPEEFSFLFFEHFFKLASSLYISASPFLRYAPLLNDIIDVIHEENAIKAEDLIDSRNGSFHIAPPIYSTLGLPYLDFALTVADVAVAANALTQICELPPALRGISYAKFPKAKLFKMFAVRAFVRKNAPSPPRDGPCIAFDVSELTVADNPDFERAFLSQHLAGGAHAIDLTDALGADACNLTLPAIQPLGRTTSIDEDSNSNSLSDGERFQSAGDQPQIESQNNTNPNIHNNKNCQTFTPMNSVNELENSNNEKEIIDSNNPLNNNECNDTGNNDANTSNDDGDIKNMGNEKSKFNERIVSDSNESLQGLNNENKSPAALQDYLQRRKANLLIRQAHVFEDYLRFRVARNEYEEYANILSDYDSVVCAPLAMNIATYARDLYDDPSSAFQRAVTYFHTPRLQRLVYLVVRSKPLKKCFAAASSQISRCNAQCLTIIQKLRATRKNDQEEIQLSRGRIECLRRSVLNLISLRNSPAAMQIDLIDQTLIALNILGNGKEQIFYQMLHKALLDSTCEIFLSLVVAIDICVVQDSLFRSEMGEESFRNWTLLSKFVDEFTSTSLTTTVSEVIQLRRNLEELKKKIQFELKKCGC